MHRLKGIHKTLIASTVGLVLSLVLALSPVLPSSAISVADVPNPQVANGTWVMDMAEMLSPESEVVLNTMISNLEAINGIEIAVVTVPDTQPSSSPKAFATELFNAWGIGKKGADNGLLFLISKGDRRNEIETGYGLEGVLSDAQVGAILREQVTPQFKVGNFDAGVLAGMQTIVGILSGEISGDAYNSASGTDLGSHPLLGWLFNGVGATAIAIGAAAIAVLKKLTKRHTEPIYIGPTGHSELTVPDVFLGPLLATVLRSLLHKDIATAKGLVLLKGNTVLPTESVKPKSYSLAQTFSRFTRLAKNQNSQNASHHQEQHSQPLDNPPLNNQHLNSQLVAIRWHEDLIRSGWKIFGLLLILSCIGGYFLQEQVLWLTLFTWLWLGYELWANARWVQHHIYNSQAVGPSVKATVITLVRVSLRAALVTIVLITVINIIAILTMPFFLTAFFGACAGVLRLVRSLPGDHAIHCQACNTPMQQLSDEQLTKYIRKAQKVEMSLGNKFHEGWYCQTCAVNQPITDKITQDTPKNIHLGQSLSVHLFNQVITTAGYDNCPTCDAFTLKVEETVIENATISKTGRKRMIKDCQCCKYHSEEECVIPKEVPVTTSSSSSSYSSGSYSSGSYSSGSGGSFGGGSSGSFGGGSSGGGGAGDSW